MAKIAFFTGEEGTDKTAHGGLALQPRARGRSGHVPSLYASRNSWIFYLLFLVFRGVGMYRCSETVK